MIAESLRGEPAFGFLVLAVIVICGPLIAKTLRLPGLIGLLMGGALIGPNILGVMDDFSGIQAVGQLGVLYLIFLAGLGLDMKTFEENRTTAATFSIITALIPWILGTAVAVTAGYELKTAILIGSFWASFTLVSYGIVTRHELTRNASIAATVGASSITDTIGLVALAVVVGSETGDASSGLLMLKVAAGLAVVAVYCMVILPAVTKWFFAGLGQERELRFMMVLVGVTSAAVVAKVVAIEPLIGAFFAGLGLNRLVPNESRLMERTDFFGNALFIPAFLVSVGLLVNPAVMFQGSTLRLAGGLAVALLVGKALAAWITGRVYGFSRDEIGLMFSLSTAQAAATLASTVIGFQIGLYGEDVVNAVMVVIVVSLFVTGAGSEFFAPRVGPSESSDLRLGETVVVPLNDGVDATNSIWLGGQIAQPDGGLVIPVGVAVTDEPGALDETRDKLEEFGGVLRGLGLTGEPELRVARSVAGGIDRFVLENDGSLVLLTWPGPRDLRTALLGGGNDEIAAATDRPVAMVALRSQEIQRVLVGLTTNDLKPGSLADARLAMALATGVAESSGADLVFGPASKAELEKADVALPGGATHAQGPRAPIQWVDKNATLVDLVVLPARGRPVALMQRFKRRNLSVVVTAHKRNDRWYSREGALGITMPRSTKPSHPMATLKRRVDLDLTTPEPQQPQEQPVRTPAEATRSTRRPRRTPVGTHKQ